MTIRVLQVIGRMDRGGAETMIMNLYRNINRDVVQFDFLVHSREKGAYDDEIKSLGGNIYYIKPFRAYNTLSYYFDCVRFFKRHSEIKVVHGHIGSSAAIYLKAAKKFSCYTIAHSHNALGKCKNLHDVLYKIYSYPTRYIADQLFGCSTEAGISRFGKGIINKRKYRNFPNGINLEQYTLNSQARNLIREEFCIDVNDLVIGSVGRFSEQKNPFFIFQVFKYLVTSNENVKCIWSGKGELFNSIQQLVMQYGLQNKIILTGVRSDIPNILQAMDCFLFPSLWEGLPVTIIEAQASGVGIVLSDVISHEVDITGSLHWLSLNDSIEKWAQECINVSKSNLKSRSNPFKKLKERGYDVTESSMILQEFYCEKANNK